MKQDNPTLPILIREAEGTDPKITARFGTTPSSCYNLSVSMGSRSQFFVAIFSCVLSCKAEFYPTYRFVAFPHAIGLHALNFFHSFAADLGEEKTIVATGLSDTDIASKLKGLA